MLIFINNTIISCSGFREWFNKIPQLIPIKQK